MKTFSLWLIFKYLHTNINHFGVVSDFSSANIALFFELGTNIGQFLSRKFDFSICL